MKSFTRWPFYAMLSFALYPRYVHAQCASPTSGCSSCASVLPLGVTGLTAVLQGSNVQLHWMRGISPAGNGVYYAERSVDGVQFETFASVDADASGAYTVSDLSLSFISCG